MRYALLILFVAGCADPGNANPQFINKETAHRAGNTMACAFSDRRVCVCVWKDSWYTMSGLAIDPTGRSCQ